MIACANKECGYKQPIVSAEDAAEDAAMLASAGRLQARGWPPLRPPEPRL